VRQDLRVDVARTEGFNGERYLLRRHAELVGELVPVDGGCSAAAFLVPAHERIEDGKVPRCPG
jgi:hypothetical protein